jgi:hypothetical protein
MESDRGTASSTDSSANPNKTRSTQTDERRTAHSRGWSSSSCDSWGTAKGRHKTVQHRSQWQIEPATSNTLEQLDRAPNQPMPVTSALVPWAPGQGAVPTQNGHRGQNKTRRGFEKKQHRVGCGSLCFSRSPSQHNAHCHQTFMKGQHASCQWLLTFHT